MGRRIPYEKDHAHIAQLRAMYPDIPLRVMITNEDFICREYALFLPEKENGQEEEMTLAVATRSQIILMLSLVETLTTK